MMNSILPTREESMARFMAGAARIAQFTRDMPYTVPDRLEERALDHGDAPFILFEDQRISFAQANRRANQIGRAALGAGLRKGDVVALLMENRPEFVLVWLGLAKAGIVTALINTSATGNVLQHALDQVEARAMIVGTELLPALDTLEQSLSMPCWQSGEAGETSGTDLPSFEALYEKCEDGNLPPDARAGIVASDPLYLIFTSGTTGLPKAAKMSHLRFLNSGEVIGGILRLHSESVFYCVLPLYHGAGGMVVPSTALAFGIPFVLRRKFSRSGFWEDVKQHRITDFYYIGEVVRYLLATPEHEAGRDITLRGMAGAGLKPDVWRAFVERFGIEQVVEGLGSTEANYGITNVDNVVGSVGRIPYPEHSNVRVIRWDANNACHMRDAAGAPVLAKAGEVGELIAEVLHADSPAGFFEGYTCADATEAKLMRNVFKPADVWFRSGDLVRFDEEDYFYFVDRAGDTFRWKSENVSTQEVEAILSGFAGPQLANVYGVKVSGTEGRAGMVALTYPDGVSFDAEAFYDYVERHLAHYARPLFVRLAPVAEMTTSFKLKKVALQQQGYDPELAGGEPIFVADPDARTYVPVTDATLHRLGLRMFEQDED
ncbi:long-chain-acyl-CoA synthetase [Croceicoccus sp. F390]|uniref:Long-chain-acyl-CoA synthetase n=1 Tax=Croceicoccus esteveae TaxID=3075597 RepID=A0ABU2ZH24_9SPHN|nr:long-chain-acyl-CoA synthetase [Croceicoccus sp. F390]MDT0575373.1 long-chain-acyl-CoA synthetase [Croceicoccus sp. F390]